MRRVVALVVSVGFAVAVLWPVVRDADSFPLSNYPMFSHQIDAVNDVRTVIGREPDGTRRLLSPQLIADSDEVMIALQTVSDAIFAGHADDLCATVVDRLDGDAGLVRVEVVTERYDTVAWFRGDRDPLSVRVHAACEVAA